MESPGNLPQTIERWMIRRNKWNPFPPPLVIGPISRILLEELPYLTYVPYLFAHLLKTLRSPCP